MVLWGWRVRGTPTVGRFGGSGRDEQTPFGQRGGKGGRRPAARRQCAGGQGVSGKQVWGRGHHGSAQGPSPHARTLPRAAAPGSHPGTVTTLSRRESGAGGPWVLPGEGQGSKGLWRVKAGEHSSSDVISGDVSPAIRVLKCFPGLQRQGHRGAPAGWGTPGAKAGTEQVSPEGRSVWCWEEGPKSLGRGF